MGCKSRRLIEKYGVVAELVWAGPEKK